MLLQSVRCCSRASSVACRRHNTWLFCYRNLSSRRTAAFIAAPRQAGNTNCYVYWSGQHRSRSLHHSLQSCDASGQTLQGMPLRQAHIWTGVLCETCEAVCEAFSPGQLLQGGQGHVPACVTFLSGKWFVILHRSAGPPFETFLVVSHAASPTEGKRHFSQRHVYLLHSQWMR